MAEFKPMVKMYTDEPSVILKLKKGGKVHHKAHHKSHEEHGHKSMHHAAGGSMHGAHHAFDAEAGHSPKKPSMSARRRAMNPQLFKKGGKVAHKQLGGGMPMGYAPRASAAPLAAMGRPALAGMAPAARAARADMVRRALTGMKKGGHAGLEKHVAKLEKELHHHEALSAKKAHHKADGGAIDKAETRTTLKNSVAPFAKTKVDDGQKHDKVHGTGEIHEGKPGGFKHGGRAKHHKHGGRHAMGGTIEGNEGKFENTFVVDGDHADTAHGTGDVRMGNAGGFKRGGKAHHKHGGHHKVHHKAKGGHVPGLTSATIEGGNWENRPANTSKPGKTNTKTGEVITLVDKPVSKFEQTLIIWQT